MMPINRNVFRLAVVLAAGLLGVGGAGCAMPNDILRQNTVDALRTNDVPTADRYISQAVKQDPTDWQAQYLMGKVRLAEGQPLKAESCLQQALANLHGSPDADMVLDALAEANLKQGDRAKLTSFLKDTVSTHPTVRGYLRQAKYLSESGDKDGAAVAYKKAQRIAPRNDAAPFLAAADFYGSIGDKENELMALRRAYTADRDNTIVLGRLRGVGQVPGPALLLAPEE